jgi:ATP-dependent Clp protease adapter protein ClpS
MSHTILQPETPDVAAGSARWMVILYNNEYNSVDEVVDVLMRATGCDVQEASIETWEAHTFGKAPVHFAQKDECDSAAAIIASIGCKTEVLPEWED